MFIRELHPTCQRTVPALARSKFLLRSKGKSVVRNTTAYLLSIAILVVCVVAFSLPMFLSGSWNQETHDPDFVIPNTGAGSITPTVQASATPVNTATNPPTATITSRPSATAVFTLTFTATVTQSTTPTASPQNPVPTNPPPNAPATSPPPDSPPATKVPKPTKRPGSAPIIQTIIA